MRLLRSRTVHVLVLALGLVQLAKIAYLLTPPHLDDKDFRQDYVLARSLLDGAAPYEPLPVLFARYLGTDGASLPSPSSHPPSALALFVPLAFLSYPVAAAIWTATCLLVLGASVRTLARQLGWRPTALQLGTIVAGLLLWPPVMLDLSLGQLTVPLLGCIVAAWAALRSGREEAAGVWLGVGAALKLLPALLVVALLLRRRWRAAGAAAVTFVIFAMPATVRFGPEVWGDYFGRVLPTVTAVYQDICPNLSLYGLFYRHIVGHAFMLPLFPMVPLVPLTLAAQGMVVAAALALVWRRGDWTDTGSLDVGWSVVILAMLLASPLTWHLSFVLLLLPLAVFARAYADGKPFATQRRLVHALVVLGATAPLEVLAAGARSLATGLGWHAGDSMPAASGLVLSLPTVALLTAFILVAGALMKRRPRTANASIGRSGYTATLSQTACSPLA